MGTRSLVLKPHGDGFEGRYVHYDGYPTGVGIALLRIVKRDGLEKARKTIIDDHYYWSCINESMFSNRYNSASKDMVKNDYTGLPTGNVVLLGEQRGVAPSVDVIGYGEADLNSPRNEEEYADYLMTPENYGDQGWAEWTYLLAESGLWVAPYNADENPPRYQIVVPWDGAENILENYSEQYNEEADRLWALQNAGG